MNIPTSAISSCIWIFNSHRSYDTLNLGKPSKPKYATEQQDETVSIIRSSFRAEMSNFSNSIKYLGKLLNFQVFPTATKRDCTSAHLFGFSQQSGLSARPEMKLQKCTLDCLRNMGCLAKSSSALNHVPTIPSDHVFIHIPLVPGDSPANSAKQYSKYQSFLKRRKKNQEMQPTP